MVDASWLRMWDIFHEALSREDPASRDEYLETACEGDAELRREVDALLQTEIHAGNDLLDQPEATLSFLFESDEEVEQSAEAIPSAPAETTPNDSLHPNQIGQYRTTRVIAEGGMGIVYEAEQEFPRRTVALKTIRPGSFSETMARQFHHEIELLGRLRHPGIAQIYEAGIQDAGEPDAPVQLPWFAMEFIDGEPITHYARTHELDTASRLTLFSTLCETVQYAHDRGVIHRDLKPANILIDEHGQPRVLDFGIARAFDPTGVESLNVHTMTGENIVGTIAYMSPEQLGGGPEKIDTRTDVYSLGIVLYELLTGSTPFGLEQMSIAAAIQTVLESDPPAPSSLEHSIDRDLDTIVLRALHRNTSSRYASVTELAQDVERFMKGEPIQARRKTPLERVVRVVKRQRALSIGIAACIAAILLATLGGVLAAFLALFIGIVGTGAGLYRANRARFDAERFAKLAEEEADKAQRIQNFLSQMLTSLDPREAQGEELRVRDLLDKAALRASEEFVGRPGIEASVSETIGNTYLAIGEYEKARTLIEHAASIRENVFTGDSAELAKSYYMCGLVDYYEGKYESGEKLIEKAISMYRELDDPSPFDVALAHRDLGLILMRTGEHERAESEFDIAIEMMRKIPDVDLTDLANAMSGQAILFRTARKFEEAEKVYHEVLDIFHEKGREESVDYAALVNNLGVLHSVQGHHRRAAAYFNDTLVIRRRLLPPNHPELASILNNLAGALWMMGRNDEAAPYYEESLNIRRASLAPDHPDIANTLIGYGFSRMAENALDEAQLLFREAYEIRKKSLSADHPRVANAAASLAFCLHEKGELTEARDLLIPATEILVREWSEKDGRVHNAFRHLAEIHEGLGEQEAATQFRARLERAAKPTSDAAASS